MEEHISKVFCLNEDLNYLVVYIWCFLNGKKKIAEYWEVWDPNSINPLIQDMLTSMDLSNYNDLPLDDGNENNGINFTL
jgi:hypothetical protein